MIAPALQQAAERTQKALEGYKEISRDSAMTASEEGIQAWVEAMHELHKVITTYRDIEMDKRYKKYAQFAIEENSDLADFIEYTGRWSRRADLEDLGWEPDLSETIIPALRDTVRNFGLSDGSDSNAKAKKEG